MGRIPHGATSRPPYTRPGNRYGRDPRGGPPRDVVRSRESLSESVDLLELLVLGPFAGRGEVVVISIDLP